MKQAENKIKANPTTSGFTLIELLVIIIMVGILATIVAPSWLGFLNRQRIGSVKSDLVQTIKQTQTDAIQRRESVIFEVKEDEAFPTVNNKIDITLAQGSGIRSEMIRLDAYSVDTSDGSITDDADLTFDYQGKPINEQLPFVIAINAQNSNTKQCVIIANLLGSIKTAEGATCDNPPVAPVEPS
jgi:type II secretory pathway pseudopilin PulG